METESSQHPSPWSSSSTPPQNPVESFLGSFVILISNDDLRYEGVLYYLNLQDSTLGLQNVICYGTDGKNITSYDYINFSGSDINDIQVFSLPAPKHDYDLVIGHVISIITTENVRCEGLITHVNIQDSLIFMKNVECFGSEGRNRRKRLEVGACKQLLGPSQFRYQDIKDVEIIFLPKDLHEETASDQSDDFPILCRTHLGHRQGI